MFFVLHLIDILTRLAGCPEKDCPTSALTPIAAAFATQGYFVQADLLWQLSFTNLGIWAIIVFIAAAVGGMISMVLGNPPRHYVWFFLGPALYVWLIDTTQEVKGVRWEIGLVTPMNQEESWKLAETGLRNSNITERQGLTINVDGPPGGTIKVATAFLFWDELISSTVQHLVSWTGINRQLEGHGSKTNISRGPGGRMGRGVDDWTILSHQKWSMLENVTAARVHNPQIRDAFVSFMSSECGDLFTKSIDKPAYLAATRLRGSALADTIGSDFSVFLKSGYPMSGMLIDKRIPFPKSLATVFAADDSKPGAFGKFNNATNTLKDKFANATDVTCSGFLYLIIQAFRWEAGHIYHQMLSQPSAGTGGRPPLDPEWQLYSLFYGWDIKKGGSQVDSKELERFTKNLILVHLIRNELELAPNIMANRYSYAKESENYVDAYQKSTGAKTKYGELYSWARLLPYVQGLLLYGLAAIYPVACVLIIMPGWSKTIFTWMAFWAWAKLWDVGFALVMVLERSIWAMMGNSVNNAALNKAIAEMADISDVTVSCGGGGGGGALTCVVADVTSNSTTADGWSGALDLLDKSIAYGMAMNYDLANGYYIYIMAALYFAVPAVMGQLVLSGRSGMGGVANAMIGDVSKAGGQKAGEGFLGRTTLELDAARHTGKQTARAASLRQSGLGEKALDFGNKALEAGLQHGSAQQLSAGYGHRSTVDGFRERSFQSANNVPRAGLGFLHSGTNAFGALGQNMARSAGSTGANAVGDGQKFWQLMSSVSQYGGDALQQGGLGMLAVGDNVESQRHLGVATAFQARQAELGVGAMGWGQRQSGYNSQGQRVSQQAQFAAEEAAWEFARSYGSDKMGAASAAGIWAGHMNVGERPHGVEGFASHGMLGAGAQSAFHFADPDLGGANGFFSQIGASQRSLHQEVGSGAVWSHMHTSSPGSALVQSAEATFSDTSYINAGTGLTYGQRTGGQLRSEMASGLFVYPGGLDRGSSAGAGMPVQQFSQPNGIDGLFKEK